MFLQYSINEIYGFRKSGKFHEAKQKYNEIYHIYGELTEEGNVDPECSECSSESNEEN